MEALTFVSTDQATVPMDPPSTAARTISRDRLVSRASCGNVSLANERPGHGAPDLCRQRFFAAKHLCPHRDCGTQHRAHKSHVQYHRIQRPVTSSGSKAGFFITEIGWHNGGARICVVIACYCQACQVSFTGSSETKTRIIRYASFTAVRLSVISSTCPMMLIGSRLGS